MHESTASEIAIGSCLFPQKVLCFTNNGTCHDLWCWKLDTDWTPYLEFWESQGQNHGLYWQTSQLKPLSMYSIGTHSWWQRNLPNIQKFAPNVMVTAEGSGHLPFSISMQNLKTRSKTSDKRSLCGRLFSGAWRWLWSTWNTLANNPNQFPLPVDQDGLNMHQHFLLTVLCCNPVYQ